MGRRPAAALLALVCAASLVPAPASASPTDPLSRPGATGPRLVHAGVPAQEGERPFQAAVLESGVAICGGVVLDARRIASAAHCVFGGDQDYLVSQAPGALRVHTGSVRLGRGGEQVQVEQVSFDPRFDARSLNFDVAVLRLDRPLALGERTRAIAPAAASPPDGTPALVSGWGQIADNDPYQPGARYPDTLRVGELRTVSDAACASAYPELPPAAAATVCTTSADPGARTDACQGDSGGPLTAGGVLVGLVSSGTECGNPRYPGVQTEVAEPGVRAFLTRADLPPAPRPGGPVTLAGSGRAGEELSCVSPTWSGSPTLRFQWLRDGGRLPDVPVSEPSADPAYVPSAADAGRRLYCVVRATGEGGYGVAASGLSEAVAARPGPVPPASAPPPPAGDLRPVPPLAAAADVARPVVRVPRASCSSRTRRCTLTVTVSDRRPSAGIARLEARVTSSRRTTCLRRTGKTRRRVACIRTRVRTLRPKSLGNLTFRVDAANLPYGSHRFRLVAVDRAGRRSLAVGRTLTLARRSSRPAEGRR
jgi:trypsin